MSIPIEHRADVREWLGKFSVAECQTLLMMRGAEASTVELLEFYMEEGRMREAILHKATRKAHRILAEAHKDFDTWLRTGARPGRPARGRKGAC